MDLCCILKGLNALFVQFIHDKPNTNPPYYYIYIEREREGERDREIEGEREREKD